MRDLVGTPTCTVLAPTWGHYLTCIANALSGPNPPHKWDPEPAFGFGNMRALLGAIFPHSVTFSLRDVGALTTRIRAVVRKMAATPSASAPTPAPASAYAGSSSSSAFVCAPSSSPPTGLVPVSVHVAKVLTMKIGRMSTESQLDLFSDKRAQVKASSSQVYGDILVPVVTAEEEKRVMAADGAKNSVFWQVVVEKGTPHMIGVTYEREDTAIYDGATISFGLTPRGTLPWLSRPRCSLLPRPWLDATCPPPSLGTPVTDCPPCLLQAAQ